MKYKHKKYGSLVVEPVSPIMKVRDIRGEDFPEKIKFDIEVAEQITLITENDRTQIAFQDNKLGYLIVNETPSTARVMRIVSIDYQGENARETIEREAKKHEVFMFRKQVA